MNTLESNRYTRAWRAMGASLPRPRAVLAISAHWYIGATAVTAMSRPRTIHDFYGFPRELYEVGYPAPGAPEIAQEIVDVAQPMWIGMDREEWGLDHGTWSVLVHLYPDADVPVLQLAINSNESLEYHVELATKLASLRDRGILILGSGNVVHNLRRIDWKQPGDFGFDWAQRFDGAVRDVMCTDPAAILSVTRHPDYDASVPTPDHFIPLLYIAGLAGAGEAAKPFVEGCSLGSISMTSYVVGGDVPSEIQGGGAADLPAGVPPNQTNT